MKAVLQYRASPGLRRRVAVLGFPTVIVDESDKKTFLREMGDAEILLHVLEPVTAAAPFDVRTLALTLGFGPGAALLSP